MQYMCIAHGLGTAWSPEHHKLRHKGTKVIQGRQRKDWKKKEHALHIYPGADRNRVQEVCNAELCHTWWCLRARDTRSEIVCQPVKPVPPICRD